MKVSVVVTVLNEEQTIVSLIRTLINQSVKPLEIIIVDGGSTDRTLTLIKEQSQKSSVPIREIRLRGSNRSQARNEGIRQARGDIVAVTDAGCEADVNWLQQLIQKFENGIEAVGGFYLPRVTNALQRVFSLYTCVEPQRFDPKLFLPSSRSIAFSKRIWKRVGGYPENLRTCEDLVFAQKLFDTGALISTKKAIVYWRQPDSVSAYFKQIAGYAKGDVEANFGPHVRKIALVFGRYFLLWVVPFLLPLYLLYPLIKFRRPYLSVVAYLAMPVVQVVTDLAVMWGAVSGLRSTLATKKNFGGRMANEQAMRE